MGKTINDEHYLKLAETLRISVNDKYIKPQIALKQNNINSSGYTTIGTLGNFSLIIGKAKSRKTFLTGSLLSAIISDKLILGRYRGSLPKEHQTVLYFDTEQGKYHVQNSLKRICEQAEIDEPNNLYAYHLRSLNPKKRLNLIEDVIYNTDKVGFVVIDGIRDLVTSINDEQQATEISSKLLKWTEERNIHIIVVLHQNKGNNNARGHLGTEVINKAELVLSVTKQKGNEDISIVKADYSRGISPESFAFTIIDGLPMAVESYVEQTTNTNRKQKLKDLKDEDKNRLIKDVFSDERGFRYGELVKQIKRSYSELFKEHVGDNQAKDFIKECNSKGWLHQEKPKGKYTLMSSMEPP